jgi:hypothetical protein
MCENRQQQQADDGRRRVAEVDDQIAKEVLDVSQHGVS